MGLLRSVNAEHWRARANQPAFPNRWRSLFTRYGQRVHHAYGRSVIDDASKFLRQMHPLPDPIDYQRLQFGRSRTCAPRHRIHIERRSDDLAENCRSSRRPAKIAKKHRMTPVHHTRDDELIDVTQNFVERFTLFGWLRRKRCENRARLVVRRNSQRAQVLSKICNPIRQFMQLPAELFGASVAEVGLSICHSLEKSRL